MYAIVGENLLVKCCVVPEEYHLMRFKQTGYLREGMNVVVLS